MHWPAEFTEPCSWYCHRETTGGCQQEPADVLHGEGAGRAAAAACTMGFEGDPAQAGAATKAETATTAPASELNTRAPRIAASSDAFLVTRRRLAEARPPSDGHESRSP